VSEDLTLLPEVQVRRKLRKQPVRIAVLAPYGAWMGRGMLRVLRLRVPVQPFDGVHPERSRGAQDDNVVDENEVELTVGYESYEPLAKSTGADKPSEAGS
jgi:hypothetical protein